MTTVPMWDRGDQKNRPSRREGGEKNVWSRFSGPVSFSIHPDRFLIACFPRAARSPFLMANLREEDHWKPKPKRGEARRLEIDFNFAGGRIDRGHAKNGGAKHRADTSAGD